MANLSGPTQKKFSARKKIVNRWRDFTGCGRKTKKHGDGGVGHTHTKYKRGAVWVLWGGVFIVVAVGGELSGDRKRPANGQRSGHSVQKQK